MNKRTFTHADITAYYQELWSKPQSNATYTLERVRLLPELSPPTWQVEHSATYPSGYIHHFTFILIQETTYDGKPWLRLPVIKTIPEGFASPQEEDAEIERLRQEWLNKIDKETHE